MNSFCHTGHTKPLVCFLYSADGLQAATEVSLQQRGPCWLLIPAAWRWPFCFSKSELKRRWSQRKQARGCTQTTIKRGWLAATHIVFCRVAVRSEDVEDRLCFRRCCVHKASLTLQRTSVVWILVSLNEWITASRTACTVLGCSTVLRSRWCPPGGLTTTWEAMQKTVSESLAVQWGWLIFDTGVSICIVLLFHPQPFGPDPMDPMSNRGYSLVLLSDWHRQSRNFYSEKHCSEELLYWLR